MDFQKLNATLKKDPYALPFMDEVFDKVASHEVHLFLDGYFGYHQTQIACEDRYKMALITDWGAFVWVVMPFGLKNVPLAYQRIMSKTFKDYLDDLKLFLMISQYLLIWINIYPNYKNVLKNVRSMG
jgi:hypothetical protein